MSGAFYHNLYVLLPCALGKLTEPYELFDLAHVSGVGDTARTARVSERDRNVVLPADIQDLVVVLVERILVAGHAHPREDQRAPARDYVHLPLVLFDLVYGVPRDAAVKRNKIHAVFSMQPHHVYQVLRGKRREISLVVDDRIVYRDRADHGGALRRELPSERDRIAVRGQVHDGVRAEVHRRLHFLHLHVVILAVARHAEVDVDLRPEHRADSRGIDALVIPVRADRGLAFRDPLPYLFFGPVFLCRDRLHFGRYDAFPRSFHLCLVSPCHKYSPVSFCILS